VIAWRTKRDYIQTMTEPKDNPLQSDANRLADGQASHQARSGAMLTALDQRSRTIFREIVESYLANGEPVGSRTLSKRGISLSPASIRNVMADLSALGLIGAPHTSAGRLPTHAGLRVFVDGLLQIGDLNEDERADIDVRLRTAGREFEDVLQEASGLLSGLAGGAGLVTAPRRDVPIKHVEFINIGGGQALAIMVGEDGDVENRVLTLPSGLPGSALIEATNYLNARMRGRTLAETRTFIAQEMEQNRASLDSAAAGLVAMGLAEWSGEDPDRGRMLIVRGRANLLADAASAADLERVRELFEELERKRSLLDILEMAGDAQSVRLFIGSENRLFSLSGSSLIVAPYMNANRKIVGAIGVIGPTRLNYARVIPMIDYTARVLGQLIDGQGQRHTPQRHAPKG
jgi:heat-inducible transcriptional repressor